MIIIDAHQDLAWNILTFGRDYTTSAADIRRRERGTEIPHYNDDTLLGWQDYQEGQVAIIFATLFASPSRAKLGAFDTQCYGDPDEANKIYLAQMDAYDRLTDENPEKFQSIRNQFDLQQVLSLWNDPSLTSHPVGLVILMEGAEAIRHPSQLEDWWDRGVRIIGPAWRGTRFCGGTNEPGPLSKEGFELLEGMASLGFILDLSHMDERAVLQSLDDYPGQIIASHANARVLLQGTDSNRNLSNRVIQGIIERNGVIGVIPFNRFLMEGWEPSHGREKVRLLDLVAHIDHICQIAGDASHVGIGSDFDGGFGLQKTPYEIDTISDLQKLIPLLQEKGYTEREIESIFRDNWTSILRKSLPEN